MATWTAGVNRVTGDLISAADWNAYLGAGGSLDYLSSHSHQVVTVSGTRNSVNKTFKLPSTPTTEVLLFMGGATLIEGDSAYGFVRSGQIFVLGSGVLAPSPTELMRAFYGA